MDSREEKHPSPSIEETELVDTTEKVHNATDHVNINRDYGNNHHGNNDINHHGNNHYGNTGDCNTKTVSTKDQMYFKVDENPPFVMCLLFGLQHILTAFGGQITIPLLLVKPLCMDADHVGLGEIIATYYSQ